jgi:hypothetical protein
MSNTIPASSNGQTSKITGWATAVRRGWTNARYADRRLMEMRTNLSRHSG